MCTSQVAVNVLAAMIIVHRLQARAPHRAFTSGIHFMPKPLMTILRIVSKCWQWTGQLAVGDNESEDAFAER